MQTKPQHEFMDEIKLEIRRQNIKYNPCSDDKVQLWRYTKTCINLLILRPWSITRNGLATAKMQLFYQYPPTNSQKTETNSIHSIFWRKQKLYKNANITTYLFHSMFYSSNFKWQHKQKLFNFLLQLLFNLNTTTTPHKFPLKYSHSLCVWKK